MPKYLSLDKLTKYDGKIKEYLATADAKVLADAKAYSDSKDDQFEAAGSVATAKTELEGKIATAQAAADAAASKAAANETAIAELDEYVGELPEGTAAANVVAYVQEVTSGIATEGAMTDLANRVTAVEGEVDVIQGDYLKAADKNALQANIDAEAAARGEADTALDNRVKAIEDDYLKAADKTELAGDIAENASAIAAVKEDVDAFFADADMTESAKDTLKELQEYIASDESGAAAMAASIKQNSDAIDAVEDRMTTAEGKITALETADGVQDSKIATLEAKFGEGEGSVAEMIADAVAVETEARETAVSGVQADADKNADDIAALAGRVTTAEGEIDNLETAVAAKASQADLTALTTRVGSAEGEIDDLQSDMTQAKSDIDAVEAKAAANETAIGTLQTAVAAKAEQTALEAEIARATAAEQANAAAIADFVEISEEEINALFATSA